MPSIHDFKLGDLVRVAAHKYIIYLNDLCESNNHGKVIDINAANGSLCIEFFESIGGHSCGGKGKFGHCCWFDAGSVFFDMPENIFIESIRADVYMENKRYYYTDNHKEVTDKCVLFKIIKELTMKGVEIY